MSRLNPPGISLQPGETLLWQGAPDGNVRFFREDRRALLRRLPLLVFLVPLVSMCDWFPLHLFLIAPFIGAVKSGWELVMYLGELLFMLVFYQFPVLFAAVGLHAMAGHIAYKRSYARRARYYLTDRRVVLALAQKGGLPPFYVEWPLHQLYRVRVIPAWGDVGHLLIGDEMLPDYLVDTGLFRPETARRFAVRLLEGRRAERSTWVYQRYFRYYDDPARYMMLFRVPRAKDTAELIRAAAERTRVCQNGQTDGPAQ